METDILSVAYGAAETERYRDLSAEWLLDMRLLADNRRLLGETRQGMKDFEAQAVVNGEATGSNDKQRQAALDAYLVEHEGYQSLVHQARDVQQAIDESEASAEYANQQMRLIRVTLEWTAAHINLRAKGD